MTDAELELAILRRYVEHHDAVGTEAHKCARELNMREVISDIIGRPTDEAVVKRLHASLAPARPHPVGVLRPCSDSTVNNSSPDFMHERGTGQGQHLHGNELSNWRVNFLLNRR